MNIKKTEEEIMKRSEFIEVRLNVLENALKQAMENVRGNKTRRGCIIDGGEARKRRKLHPP